MSNLGKDLISVLKEAKNKGLIISTPNKYFKSDKNMYMIMELYIRYGNEAHYLFRE